MIHKNDEFEKNQEFFDEDYESDASEKDGALFLENDFNKVRTRHGPTQLSHSVAFPNFRKVGSRKTSTRKSKKSSTTERKMATLNNKNKNTRN